DGRGRHYVPAAFFQRTIHAVPHQLGCAFAASVAELQGNFRGGIGMDEIDDAPPRRFLLVVPQPGAAWRDASIATDAGHLGKDQTGATECASPGGYEMKVSRHALLSRIHAPGRHDGAVPPFHLAAPQWLEQPRQP